MGYELLGGRYRIIRTLGRGGFGITYLANHLALDCKVCIKEFFPKAYYKREGDTSRLALLSDGFGDLMDRYKSKFVKEARTIATLNHPNIIHIYDVFEENDTAYYVMDYIDGETLQDMVAAGGAMSEIKAQNYIRQLADALDYIHSRDIIHLDVKPSNVIVNKADGRVILIDFGLSKHYDSSGAQTSTTPIGISHGYAPIEQYRDGGVNTFSPRTDIYSLGATFYYLVVGKTPPTAAIVNDDGLGVLPSHLSPNVRRSIERAMQPRRKDRPASVKEFLAILATPKPVVATEDKPQPKKRSWLWLWLLLIVVIGAITAGVTYYIQSVESDMVDVAVESAVDDITSQNVREISNSGEVSLDANTTPSATQDRYNPKVSTPNEVRIDPISIDLGLSVNWAICNVGTDSEYKSGNFYSWGEIYTKYSYSENNSETYNSIVGDIEGYTGYDVARAEWGGGWRLPTQEELEELEKECIWTADVVAGYNGYRVTGPNGNSIFLPASGGRSNAQLAMENSFAGYWSGTERDSQTAYGLTIRPGKDYVSGSAYEWKYMGRLVRPVIDKY